MTRFSRRRNTNNQEGEAINDKKDSSSTITSKVNKYSKAIKAIKDNDIDSANNTNEMANDITGEVIDNKTANNNNNSANNIDESNPFGEIEDNSQIDSEVQSSAKSSKAVKTKKRVSKKTSMKTVENELEANTDIGISGESQDENLTIDEDNSSNSKPEDVAKFSESYAILRDCVEQLRRSDISNIDELLPLVERATEAYKSCKGRLESVEELVNKVLSR